MRQTQKPRIVNPFDAYGCRNDKRFWHYTFL